MAKDGLQNDELNKRLDEMIAAAGRDTAKWGPIYKDGRDYIYGNQLVHKPVREGWDRIQCNYIFPAIMQEQGLLAQRRTRVIAQPWEPTDADGAEIWSQHLQWQYEKGLNVPAMQLDAVLDGKTYGHWAAKVYWEPKARWNQDERAWEGAVRATLVRPDFVGVDPDCETETLQDARFVFIRRRVSVSWAKARWPKFAEDIDAAAGDEQAPEGGEFIVTGMSSKAVVQATADGEKGTAAETLANEGRLSAILSGADVGQEDAAGEGQGDDKGARKVTLLEIWFKDEAEKHVVEEVPVPIEELLAGGAVALQQTEIGPMHVLAATGEPLTADNWPHDHQEWDQPLYPNGRYVLRIGKRILNDRPDQQVWQLPVWPIVIGLNYKLPHTFHGLNGVEAAKTLQDRINVAAAHLMNYVKLFGDPIVKAEEGAIQNCPDNRGVAERIKARAGAIWKVAVGKINAIVREAPPPMGTGTLEAYGLFAREIRDQTGIQEIAMGRKTSGQTTATEAQDLATFSRIRTGLQALLMEDWTVRFMTVVYEMLRAHMTPGQMIRLVGQGKAPQVGAMQAAQFDARFDLRLSIATTLPYDQDRRKQEALQLYQVIGLPYLPRLLEAFEVENAEELLASVQAFQQFLQFSAGVQELDRQQQRSAG